MDAPVELVLGFPPSINHVYSYRRGRPILSKEARAYRQEVRRLVATNGIKPRMGPIAMRLEIHPPDERRRDVDNVQKSILDALQHAGVYWDDSQVVWLLSIKHEAKSGGQVKVQIDDADKQSLSPAMEIA